MTHNAIKKFYALPFKLQLLIWGVLSISIISSSYQYGLAPLHLVFKTLQHHEMSLKHSLETLRQQKARTNREIAQRPCLQQTLNSLSKEIALHAALPTLLSELLTKGNHNQLYFHLFEPIKNSTDQGYDKITVKIIAMGSFHHLANFLSDIANMPPLIMIDQFAISKEKTETELTAELILNLFLNPANKLENNSVQTLSCQLTPIPPIHYQARSLRSPFQSAMTSINHHALNNTLAAYPLSTLRLGGTVTRAGTASIAYVLTADNTMYRVKKGDEIGNHQGHVIRIQPDRLVIAEKNTVKEGAHTVTLQLHPTLKPRDS